MSIYVPIVAVLGAAAYVAATVFGIHPGVREPAPWAQEGSFTVWRLVGITAMGAVAGIVCAFLHKQRSDNNRASRTARKR